MPYRSLTVLVSVFTASLVTANLLGSKLVVLFGVTLSLGIFVFPFTFLTADIITEVYGKSKAQEVVKVGILIQIFVLFFVYLGGVLPESSMRPLNGAYDKMFGLAPRMVFASIVAYSVSQFLDVFIFARLKKLFSNRWLLIRTNLSAWLSQLADTLIFSGIFMGGVLGFHEWLKAFAVAYLAKMTVATFDSPLVNLGVKLIHHYEGHHELKS
jgi:uncharacterized integral membrane protein (TIGR00697 family)